METIFKGLLSGFIVGVICVAYVLIRSWRVQAELTQGGTRAFEKDQDRDSNNWMVMAVFSSASLVWGFIGAGIYHIFRSHFLFMLFSLIFALIITLVLLFRKTSYKFDKIILTLVITIGLGILIPYVL